MLTQEIDGCITVIKQGRGKDRFLFPVYCYLVDGLLVDTGGAITAKEFQKAIRLEQVALIVNTHSHEDHVGNNAMVAELKGAHILAHPLALPILFKPSRLHLHIYQRYAWGTPKSSRGTAMPDMLMFGGHFFSTIPTPGHSPDHICLYEPKEGWLFTGDLHVGELKLLFQRRDNFHQILDSLKELSSLTIGHIYDGHGGVIENGQNALQAKIDFIEDVKQKVEDLYNQKVPPKEISRRVLGEEEPITKWTFGDLSKLNAIKSILNRL